MIKTKKKGRFDEAELERSFQALEERYTGHFEKKFNLLAKFQDDVLFKVSHL